MNQYERSLKIKRDNINIRNFHIQKGKKQGIQEGIQKEKLEVAKNFKENGVSLEIIAKSIGLTREEILQLK